MTSSAKMRRVVAAGVVLALVGAVGGAWWLIGSRLPALPGGEFATVHLPDPIELTDGVKTHTVSRVVVNFEKRTLTLERDELAFDDYGDATRTGGADPLVLDAKFDREGMDGRFEITTGTKFAQKLRLVVLPQQPNTCRLIVLGKDGETFERILELRRPDVVDDEIGDVAQPDQFHFSTLGHSTSDKGHRLYGISVSGSLARGGHLSIDPNHYGFQPDGSVGRTTLLGWTPIEVTFKALGADPAKRGRRAFALELPATDAAKTEYVLVLGKTELSEHRLVVKTDGKTRQVLALRNTHRDNHLYMLRKLDGVPEAERQAVRDLGKAGGYRSIVQVDKGHVRSLHNLDGDLTKLDPILARLPHLTALGFIDTALPATGLPCLETLKDMAALSFTHCEVTDDGLASVGKVTGLKHLSTFGSEGFTPAGLKHLAPLTNLELLDLRRERAPADAPTFDEGVKHLAGTKRLTYLNLQGLHLTDASLAHIGKLTTLRKLYVSGPAITADGLKHLEGLTNLAEFTLYSSKVTPEALAAFRAKLPGLKK